MRVLVTGGAGFMGSHFVEHLLYRGHDVKVVDKLTYAGSALNLDNEAEKRSWYGDYLGLDIQDIADVEICEGEYDMVVNFAAETHVDRSIRYPTAFVQTDIVGLTNLAIQCLKAKVKRLVHISTDEVYGPIAEGEATEESLLNPTSPYSGSKAAGDLLLMCYHKTYGLPVVIVRPCNNFGTRQHPEKLIPMTIVRLLKGEKVILHGEGEEVREWIWVEDCVSLVYKACLSGKDGHIYNAGSGLRYSNLQVIKMIMEKVLGGYDPERIRRVPNRPGNDARYAICSDKLKGLLGHNPFYSTIRGVLNSMVLWYKERLFFYDNVDFDSNIYVEGEGYLR